MKRIIAIVLTAVLAVGCAAFAGADGQNPAMNIIGDYYDTISQRATMQITASGEKDADVTVQWGNSAAETVVWHFSGPCVMSDKGITIEYNNGVKKILSSDGNGTINEKIDYENGTGKLVFDENISHPVWTDDQEDTGARCAFEYAPVDNTTNINGLSMGESESAVRKTMGEPAAEGETAGMKELVYKDVPFLGGKMKFHILIDDDTVRAIRVVTHEGGAEAANNISKYIETLSNGADPELTEEKVRSLGEKYCGLTDFSQLGYFSRYAQDGCMMIYIRTSEKDIELLVLDHYLQSREE